MGQCARDFLSDLGNKVLNPIQMIWSTVRAVVASSIGTDGQKTRRASASFRIPESILARAYMCLGRTPYAE
jgi:hypothetical protein